MVIGGIAAIDFGLAKMKILPFKLPMYRCEMNISYVLIL
jgi:hypothetical protein